MKGFILFTVVALSGAAAAADASIKRLPPSAFPELPSAIRQTLEHRTCRIPQIWEGWKVDRHNVIRGAFFKKRQTDWAVLCSIDGKSTVLVFPQGSSRPAAELAAADDELFVQTVNQGELGFSRAINATDPKRILQYYKEYGGPKPPPLNHQGINDAFVEKASVIRYFHKGKWIELSGAD